MIVKPSLPPSWPSTAPKSYETLTPNLNDPRSRGWGDRTYQRWLDELPFLNAAIYTAILIHLLTT